MTKFEKMTKQIETLMDAALRCVDRGSSFYEVWFRNANELRNLRDNLSIAEAIRKV